MEYEAYLKTKDRAFDPVGIDDKKDINAMLWDYQVETVDRSLHSGRYLNMMDCGLGKTPIQLEWGHHVAHETGKPVLFVAPLQVCYQTERESKKFNRPVTFTKSQPSKITGNIITNYESLHKFSPDKWGGIVLDESSILKGQTSKTRLFLNEFAKDIHFRLCCSATPSPNDFDEILRHAEFLGIGREAELHGEYFMLDGNNTTKWRLRRYAEDKFWKWLSSWTVAMRKPSDLGYNDDNFVRGDIHRISVVVKGEPTDGMLFAISARTLMERRRARKSTIEDRTDIAARLINNPDSMRQYVPDYDINEPVVVWCDLNSESQSLANKINKAVEVTGSQSPEIKAQRMIDFSDGKIVKLVTKPKIAGHGMNWQHCRIQLFVGLSDSYEQVYQAERRIWRNMQTRDVYSITITADTEGNVLANQKRKKQQHERIYDKIIENTKSYWNRLRLEDNVYNPEENILIPEWLISK